VRDFQLMYLEGFLVMRTAWFQWCGVLLFSLAGGGVLQAEDDPVPPANRPDPAALRERAKKLSPEERQKLVREFREKHGLVGTNRSEWEKRREELKALPPAEREAKLKELRQEIQQGRRQFKLLSSEDRETKRKEMKQRIDAQVTELQKLKTAGTITEPEGRRLDRMQQMSERLARGEADNPKGAPAPKGPRASETDALPPPKITPKSGSEQ
jgi:hypothetical protein